MNGTRVIDDKIILSDNTKNIIRKLIIKNSFGLSDNDIKQLDSTTISIKKYYEYVDEIVRRAVITIDFWLINNNDNNLDNELFNKLVDLCNIFKNKYSDLDTINLSYRYEIDELNEIINHINEIYNTEYEMYLLRDLINSREECISNLKYILDDSKIEEFNNEFLKAINNKDINKLKELVNKCNNLVLNEWSNYSNNIDSMSDEDFCFIGHSTSATKFDKPFYGRYISCSLYNQDINDTYNSSYGFIMGPENIVGASSSDMYISNYTYNEEDICNCTSVLKIMHPKRILEETIKMKKENPNEKIYSEIVKKDFKPIGIFCFTNGEKELDYNYKRTLELQKSFPNLKIKPINRFKTNTVISDKYKIDLLNNLKKYTNDIIYIDENHLYKYDMFFDNYKKLIRGNNYTIDDVVNIFNRNIELLSILKSNDYTLSSTDILFSGTYNEEEIKYILDYNFEYNIKLILNGEITTPYELNKLSKLLPYKDRLNKYYDGLEEFVLLISRQNVDDEMVFEIRNLKPLNFYTMSKYLASKIETKIRNEKEIVNSEINNLREKYEDLIIEKEKLQNDIEKYYYYNRIKENRHFASLIVNDYNKCMEDMKNQDNRERAVTEVYNDLINQYNSLLSEKETLENTSFTNSIMYTNNMKQLNDRKTKLSKHRIINYIRLRKVNKEIEEIESNNIIEQKEYHFNKQNMINSIEMQIRNLLIQIDKLKESIEKINLEKELSSFSLEVLKNKMKAYFDSDTIDNMNDKIDESNDYLNNYDIFSENKLLQVEKELQSINISIMNNSRKLQNIENDEQLIETVKSR